MKPVHELKAPLSAIFTPLIGEFRIKTYFSYYGIFKDKIMLALYKDEQLYLRIAKTDLDEIKLLPNTLLLEDPNVGLATKCFYKIPPAFWESANFAQWVLKTTKTKKTKEYGIWREKTGLNGRELLKTGALRCIAPFFILRERKLRKNQIFGWLSQNEPEKLRI